MAWRRIESTYIGCVAIDTNKIAIFVDSGQLFTDILSLPDFVVAFRAGSNGHVWLQTSQTCDLGNVDVARCALGNVVLLLTTSFMLELHRYSCRSLDNVVRSRKLVAAITVRRERLLRFPVTIETG